jgi:predicted RNA-binding protein YlqC (UPF0109 family)
MSLTHIVEYLVKSLVDKPEQVSVVESQEGEMTVIRIQVADEDRGRVIGKNGQTIRAIRALMHAVSASDANVDILI